jgi:hypothetical protein
MLAAGKIAALDPPEQLATGAFDQAVAIKRWHAIESEAARLLAVAAKP